MLWAALCPRSALPNLRFKVNNSVPGESGVEMNLKMASPGRCEETLEDSIGEIIGKGRNSEDKTHQAVWDLKWTRTEGCSCIFWQDWQERSSPLKPCNVCGDAAGCQMSVQDGADECNRMNLQVTVGRCLSCTISVLLARKAFSQYCQGEVNTRETIGLLNRIGFSPISSPSSND